MVGTIAYPLALARQAVVAFAAIEAAVANAALTVLVRASASAGSGFGGVGESKSPGSETRLLDGVDPAASFDGGVVATAALTVHPEGLWVWLSAVTDDDDDEPAATSASDDAAASSGGGGAGLTLAATSAALLAARLELAGAVAGAVAAAVRNVPLKQCLLRPVHFEIMHTDLPRRQTHATPPRHDEAAPTTSDVGYGGFAGDGVGDDGSQDGAAQAAAAAQSVDFAHLMRRRKERLVAAKAQALALRARALSSAASGRTAAAEHRMDGVPVDLQTLVALLQSSDTQEVRQKKMERSCSRLLPSSSLTSSCVFDIAHSPILAI